MPTKDSRRWHGLHGPHGSVAPAISATIAVVIWAGLVAPVRGDEGVAATPYDRAALAEIAADVLMSGATSPDDSVPEETRPLGAAADETAVASEPDPDSPATDMIPASEGTTVPIRRASSASKNDTAAPTAETAGYQSNSWRQRLDTGRALSFSSGVLAAASGLDPTLQIPCRRTAARRVASSSYGFLLLRVPVNEALEKKLAGRGVQLLGRHDDHYKARSPGRRRSSDRRDAGGRVGRA